MMTPCGHTICGECLGRMQSNKSVFSSFFRFISPVTDVHFVVLISPVASNYSLAWMKRWTKRICKPLNISIHPSLHERDTHPESWVVRNLGERPEAEDVKYSSTDKTDSWLARTEDLQTPLSSFSHTLILALCCMCCVDVLRKNGFGDSRC